MKQIILAFLLIPSLVFAQNKGFEIKGNITDLADGSVKIYSTQDTAKVLSSGEIKNGSFSLTGSVPEPGLYFMKMGAEQPIYLYLDNSRISIKGTKKDIKKLKIEGSPSHKDFDDFQKIFNPLIGELNSTAALIEQQTTEEARNNMIMKFDTVARQVNATVGEFVSKRTNSYVSLFLLWVTANLNNDPITLQERFNSLSEEIRNSQGGKALTEYLTNELVGAIGTMAVDFTQGDTAGKPVTLSSFKGKYVLVDFWASWCRPCRIENPNVVKAYNKFKDKNFTILGVSLDQKKEDWIKAIEKDKLSWTNVSDLGYWDNQVAKLYKVRGIPQNFLIDPSGKIIAKDLRGAELEKKLCELLGCN